MVQITLGRIYRSISCVVVFLLCYCAAARADYLTPQKAGFHHCALIYYTQQRDAKAFLPYAVRMRDGRPSSDWMFDAFLFLTYSLPDGTDTEAGLTTKSHWSWLLDTWFTAGRDLSALDQAISQASDAVGSPPSKRKVILTIPWPNPAVKEFGDVDNDGISENLALVSDREKVMRWYVDEATRRFRQANYRHLELWGFYWMRERIDSNPESVFAAARIVHNAKFRFLWIPWYKSAGWQNAYRFGFDAVIMQPNYAFQTWLDGGSTKASRLESCAKECKEQGYGVEIENRSNPPNPIDGRLFREYLAYGSSKMMGYQNAVNAYFLDTHYIENTYYSQDAKMCAYYELLADYVTGKTIPDPNTTVAVKWTTTGNVNIANGASTKSYGAASLNIVYDRNKLMGWRGIVAVETPNDKRKYTPVGWAARTNNGIDKVECISVPISNMASKLRIRFDTLSGSFNPSAVRRVYISPTAPSLQNKLSVGKPYTISPDIPARSYPDSGQKLIDGAIDTSGFHSGLSVGWMSTQLQIMLDLGSVQKVTELNIHVLGGGSSGVNWPKQVDAALAADQPVSADTAGLGARPKSLMLLSSKEVKRTTVRSASDASGVVILRAKQAVPTRYITLSVEPDIWLMISEVTVRGVSAMIPVNSYRLLPKPSAAAGTPFVDDGRKLTDGVSSEALNSGLVEFTGSGNREVTIDLGSIQKTQDYSVTLLSDLYSSGNIPAPAKVEFTTSADGHSWSQPLPTVKAAVTDGRGIFDYSEYRAAALAGAAVRYVRATITPTGSDRTLVSELTVR